MLVTFIVAGIAIAVPLSLYFYAKLITEKPKYYILKGSKLHRKAEKHIRLLHEAYQPSWWCPFGAAQTVVRQVLRDCPSLPFIREIVEYTDGGCAGIDWMIPDGTNENTPIVVFLPGITGSTHDSSYILHAVCEAADQGWRSVVVNPRGLGGVPLRNKKTYNACYSDDIAHVLKIINERFPNSKKLACGFSMGGMILWHYLSRYGEKAQVDGAMIISSPWDPFDASESIERFFPRLIFNRFLANNLINIVKPYRSLFEDIVDFEKVLSAKTVREFDTAFVCPLFGYPKIDDYFHEAALHPKVDKIQVPIVALNSIDDCFSPIESIPLDEISQSPNVLSIITSHGGHTAFMSSANPNARGLVERLLHQWGTMIFENQPEEQFEINELVRAQG